jgi:hypothetical protein
MGSSYISNHIHVVFSTKNRVRSISDKMQPRLWAYMAGIAENHGMHAVKIGGIDLFPVAMPRVAQRRYNL